jgi:hypothetical protein
MMTTPQPTVAPAPRLRGRCLRPSKTFRRSSLLAGPRGPHDESYEITPEVLAEAERLQRRGLSEGDAAALLAEHSREKLLREIWARSELTPQPPLQHSGARPVRASVR